MIQRMSAPFGPHTAGTHRFGTGVLFGVLVAFLVVCYVAPFLLAPIEVDFGRDLNFGYRIASGEEWVAIGPRIGTGWHVGPAWYYLLALPMLLFRSLTATVIFVAAVAALQFLLAFQIGRRMLGMRFGVAWAVMLTLPGISTLESIWVAHPSLVGVTSLATASALWNAYQQRSWPWLYTACVVFGLALHAHPTTLPLAVFFPFVFFGLVSGANVENDRPSPLWRATLCVLLVLLPFAPLLIDAQAQVRSLFVFSHDVVNASAGWRDRSVSAVAANLFWHIPNLVVATFLGENSAVLRMWKVFLTILHFVAVLGIGLALLRPALDLRRHATWAIAYFLFSALVILAVRSETRFYMTYALLPVVAFLQAVALTAWIRHGGNVMRRVADVLLAATLVAFSMVAVARLDEARSGYVRLPDLFGPNMDIGVAHDRKFVRLDSLPMWNLDAIGKILCDAGSVHAYGDLSIVVDSQYNVPARLHCGERSQVTLGGLVTAGEMALYLLPAADAGLDAATRRFGSLALGRVASTPYPGRGIALIDGGDYATRPGCASVRTHSVDFVTAPQSTVVIAPSLPAHCPIRVVRVSVGGVDLTLASTAALATVLTPTSSASEWHLEVETGDVGALQVFTISDSAPSPERARAL